MAPVLLNPSRFAAAGGGGYAGEVLADSPAWWGRQGDSSGTVMTDSSGNARDGAYVGSPTLGATGLISPTDGTAVAYSGSSQYGTVANAAWMTAANTFTAECWIKATSVGGTQDAFTNAHGSLTSRWMLRVASSQLQFYTWSGSAWTEIHASISAGVTYHIAATYDASVKRLYVDGALISTSGAVTVAQGTVAAGFGIAGLQSGSELFGGTVDEAAFYTPALSGARIAAHSTAGGH